MTSDESLSHVMSEIKVHKWEGAFNDGDIHDYQRLGRLSIIDYRRFGQSYGIKSSRRPTIHSYKLNIRMHYYFRILVEQLNIVPEKLSPHYT